MDKWHLTSNGEPAKCSAKIRSCPRGDVPHFNSPEQARAYYEIANEENLLPTVSRTVSGRKKSSSPFKKFSKVAGGVLVGVIALNGVSNIGNHNSGVSAVPDEKIPTENVSSENNENNKTKDGYIQEGKEFFDKSKEVVSEGVSKAGSWLEGNKTFQNSVSSIKEWVNDFINYDKTPSDVSMSVKDDGTILWGGKSLTPTEAEVENAKANLQTLNVAPKKEINDYKREETFGKQGDGTRGVIERRDLVDASFNSKGRAVSGTLKDPYTGDIIRFNESDQRPYDLEHIVALKDVEKSENPQYPLSSEQKVQIANDPNNLILVTSSANRSKSDKTAKDWLPSYAPSQCRFAIETITVKSNYKLNIDKGEKDVLESVLNTRCEVK